MRDVPDRVAAGPLTHGSAWVHPGGGLALIDAGPESRPTPAASFLVTFGTADDTDAVLRSTRPHAFEHIMQMTKLVIDGF